ncbi:MAG: hypothetical protein K0R67_3964, partial [Paenibacillus sp.]|nr:hypothetical protein [Paenibacillus sp.]
MILRTKKLSLILIAGMMLLVTIPSTGFALTNEEIANQLNLINKKAAEASKKEQEALKQSKDVAQQKAQETKSIEELWKQIEAQNDQLKAFNAETEQVTGKLIETNEQLVQAEERVASRDNMLKSRIRLMYTNGFVSYLEVLMESTSFGDFLDRYQALKSIVSQDKEILAANKKDRQAVAVKKVEVETQLAQVQTLTTQAELLKGTLVSKEKEKEVVIASLSSTEKQLQGITEAQRQESDKLYEQKAALLKQKAANDAKAAAAAAAAAAAKAASASASTSASASYTGGQLYWPLPGRTTLSSGFGYRVDPINKSDANHTGIDIPAPAGTIIYAAEAGTVVISGYVNGYGNTVVID